MFSEKNKNFIIVSVIAILFLAFFGMSMRQVLAADSAGGTTQVIPGKGTVLEAPLDIEGGTNAVPDLASYIQLVYNFALVVVGVVAVIMIIFGGYRYMTSAGQSQALGDAKDMITSAIIGLVMVLLSWLLLYTLNENTLKQGNIPVVVLPAAQWNGNTSGSYQWGANAATTNQCVDACERGARINVQQSHPEWCTNWGLDMSKPDGLEACIQKAATLCEASSRCDQKRNEADFNWGSKATSKTACENKCAVEVKSHYNNAFKAGYCGGIKEGDFYTIQCSNVGWEYSCENASCDDHQDLYLNMVKLGVKDPLTCFEGDISLFPITVQITNRAQVENACRTKMYNFCTEASDCNSK